MTGQEPEQLGRRSIRLKGYDYSQAGGYYITIVTQLRESFFGKICDGEMIFNDAGRMVNIEWGALQERFPNIETDIFQVMPNHLHAIIIIHNPEPVGAGLVPAHVTMPAHATRATTRVAPTIGEIIGAFKSITTHKYIQGVDEFAWPVFYKKLWQRNYYEHILHDQADYEHVAAYILDNPVNWDKDDENPQIPTGAHSIKKHPCGVFCYLEKQGSPRTG
jgi:REP element-mobilizing transposase RayT